MEKQDFIAAIASLVRKYAPGYGIAVHSPIIAQAILESNWGTSTLSAKYHNYFGLKCGSRWTGRSVNMRTNEEYTPGTLTAINDNFRVYGSMDEGVKGYFEFIQLSRYQNLKDITDPEKYLETIKADGYATSSGYAANNMKIVRQYNLTQYDAEEERSVAKLASAVIAQAAAWVGRKEADGSHKAIIDVYNAHKPLARGYAVKYTDPWCATFVSAVAVKCGLTSIIPTECGCGQMINLFKNLEEWVEDDSRTPSPGDVIFYDWQDDGKGDNAGWPDHVGIVEKVENGIITAIEGNINNAVDRRTLAINGRYIRGYGVPRYDPETAAQPPQEDKEPGTKTTAQMAQEVRAGKWGNGQERRERLEAAGYDYDLIQAEVNRASKEQAATPKKSVEEVAKEVFAGKWGNNPERKKALEAAGYDYDLIQAKVNEMHRNK